MTYQADSRHDYRTVGGVRVHTQLSLDPRRLKAQVLRDYADRHHGADGCHWPGDEPECPERVQLLADAATIEEGDVE